MSAVPEVITRFFSAWSERNPDLAVAVVTDDVTITDPYGTHAGARVLRDHIEMIIRRFDFTRPSSGAASWTVTWTATLVLRSSQSVR
jgi:SnoaL-like domain